MMEGLDILKIFVDSQIASCSEGETALEWAERYIISAYAPTPKQPKYRFVDNPLSAESLVLGAATRDEIRTSGEVSEVLGREIVRRAKKDPHTDSLARELVLQAAIGPTRIPESMGDYAKQVVSGLKRPGRQGERAWKYHNRNLIGMMVLLVLTAPNGFALNPTRNPTGNLCACDVLSEATARKGWAYITPSAAEEIWRNRARLSTETEILLALSAYASLGRRITPDVALHWLSDLDAKISGRKTKN